MEDKLLGFYSKHGYPYDNAMSEAFFKYLKQREINEEICKNHNPNFKEDTLKNLLKDKSNYSTLTYI